jgi:lipopolysaccharide biosynthesis regulator YciM
MDIFLFILVVLAILISWVLGRWSMKAKEQRSPSPLHNNYLLGLNFLLNEEPDKAVDVFIKMLEVDSETVETHLALGKLFRKRGEVNRAIRIHQNLIARPNLDNNHRIHCLIELGLDYLSAGVLDRAERVFLEVIEIDASSLVCLRSLLDIYQQEKEWDKAILIAEKFSLASHKNMNPVIAHHCCELAELCYQKGEHDRCFQLLKRAMHCDTTCVRASLLRAKLYRDFKDYKTAIECLQHVRYQNPDYLTETVAPMIECFEKCNDEKSLLVYLQDCLKQYPQLPLFVVLSQRYGQQHTNKDISDFIAKHVTTYPSIRGVNVMLQELLRKDDVLSCKEHILGIQQLTEKLLLAKPKYRCEQCGFASAHLNWLCPSCKNWNVIKPIHAIEASEVVSV